MGGAGLTHGSGREIVHVGRHRTGAFRFSVGTDVNEAIAPLAMALVGVPTADFGGAEIRYELLAGGSGVGVFADDELIRSCPTVGSAIDQLLASVNRQLLDHSPELLNFHAAAVADDTGRSLLIPGVSGEGKTTLCVELIRRGLTYLSDEMVGIEPNGLELRACPTSMTIKSGTRHALGSELDFAPFSVDGEDSARWHVPAHALGGGVRTRGTAHAILFLRRAVGVEPRLTQVSRSESVLRLLLNTFDLGRFGKPGVEVAARLASTCHCRYAMYDDAEIIAPMVADLLAEPLPQRIEYETWPGREPLGRPMRWPLGPSSAPQPSADVAGVGFADGGVLHDASTGRTALLDPIGASVWPLLDGHTPIGDLAEKIAETVDARAEEICDDLLSLCGELAQGGFIHGIAATARPTHWRSWLTAPH